MDSGFSLEETMHILQTPANKSCFDAIRSHLDNGELAETFLGQYMPSSYQSFLRDFLAYLPFLDSLQLAIAITAQEKEHLAIIEKGLLYPCMLMAGMAGGIFLFERTVLPTMLNMITAVNVSSGNVAVLAALMAWFARGLFAAVLVFTAILWLCTRQTNIVKAYRFAALHFPNSLPVQLASTQFTRFFQECVRRQISTRQSLQILSRMNQRPLIAFLASELDHSFQKGESLSRAVVSPYLESALAAFFQTAVYAEDTAGILTGYLQMSLMRTRHQIDHFTHGVQAVCYLAVGLVIIFAYRILLMPMAMMQQIGI